MVLATLVAARGRKETAGGRSEHQWFLVEGLQCVETDRENWWFFQHLVYLWLSGKQKKTRVHFQNCTCSAAFFISDWNVPASMVPWSSVHILPYQFGLVRKKELHHGRGSSIQGISYMDDKSGERQKQQNGDGWDNPEISKGRKLFPPDSQEDSGRRCLYQRVHSPEQSSEAWPLSEWGL